MTVACIVQARLGSTRLPNKVVQDLAGKPVLQHVLERCKRITGVDVVVCAVPYWEPQRNESDEMALVYSAIARRAGALLYEAPESIAEDDVLSRYVGAAAMVAADVVVRVTADCPLIDPEICWRVVERVDPADVNEPVYVSNVHPRTWPKGLDCEAFTSSLLLDAHANATGPLREHVTTYMQWAKWPHKANEEARPDRSHMRWTLDYPEDLEFMRALYAHGDPKDFASTLEILEKHPEIAEINARRA